MPFPVARISPKLLFHFLLRLFIIKLKNMFCTTLRTQYKSLLRQFDSFIDAHIDTALAVTTQLENFLASPAADMLTAIIPGNLDDAIKKQLIAALEKAVEVLTIADNCKLYTDLNDKLKCFAQQLQQRDPQLREAVLQKLASLVAANLDGQRVKQNLYDLYTQAKYTASKA